MFYLSYILSFFIFFMFYSYFISGNNIFGFVLVS